MAGQFGLRSRRSRLLARGIVPAMHCFAILLIVIPAAGAMAQELSEAPPFCLLSEFVPGEFSEQNDNSPTVLIAECNGTGINLGEVDRYSSSLNIELGAMVVEIERLGRTRVVLLQLGVAGRVEVEDLTGALLVASGLSPTNRLGGGEADISSFGRDGSISLELGAGRGQYALVPRQRFDVTEYIRQSRERNNAILAERAGEAQ